MVQQLTGGASMMPPGPDMTGMLTLGQKVEEALLTLAQAAPLIAPDMDQMRSILINALGKLSASSAGGTGTSPSAPMSTVPQQPPQPGAQPPQPAPAITPAGAQFPGKVSGNSRPY